MNQELMNAFWKGFADLVTAFFDKARKQGFSIMLLVVMSGGLLYRSAYVEDACEKKMALVEDRIERNNKANYDALNRARIDFLECDLKRQELAIKLAELTAVVNGMKNRKR